MRRCMAILAMALLPAGPQLANADPAVLLNTRLATSYDGAAASAQGHAWPAVGDEWITVVDSHGNDTLAHAQIALSESGVMIMIQSNGYVLTPVGNTDFVAEVDSVVQNDGEAGWASDGTFFAAAHGWANWQVTANSALPAVTDGDLVSNAYLVATEVITPGWDDYYHGWKTLVGTAGNLFVRANGDWTGGFHIIGAAAPSGGLNPLYGEDPLNNYPNTTQSFSIGLNHYFRSWTPTSVGETQTTGCYIDTAANFIGLQYLFNYSASASYSIHASGTGPALASGDPEAIYIAPPDGGGGYGGGYGDGGYGDGGYGDGGY